MLTVGLGAEVSASQHPCSTSLRSPGSSEAQTGLAPLPGRQLRGKGRGTGAYSTIQGVPGDRT